MRFSKDPEKHEWCKGGNDESKINHCVWYKVSVLKSDIRWWYYSLVASANHRCWAFLATPSPSDCSAAATEPQGYSAPTPIPSKKLWNAMRRWSTTRTRQITEKQTMQPAFLGYSHWHPCCMHSKRRTMQRFLYSRQWWGILDRSMRLLTCGSHHACIMKSIHVL